MCSALLPSKNPNNLKLGEGKKACNWYFPEQGKKTALREYRLFSCNRSPMLIACWLLFCFNTMLMSHFEVAYNTNKRWED